MKIDAARHAVVVTSLLCCTFPILAATPDGVLWREPTDIASRNLIYGIGGEAHAPHGALTFEKEELDGTNPKFVVRDENGVKWKVKLGKEAKPETAASRLVWAAGYLTNEDYFFPTIQVNNVPAHLKRGQNLVQPGGIFANVRLKRDAKKDGEKLGIWKWRENPFTGTREFNGLRVMMALINNWDLKDVNNAVYQQGDQKIYLVSDLGASFGTTDLGVSHDASKGNLQAYEHSKFITHAAPDFVDFNAPSAPAITNIFNPRDYISRMNMQWIGNKIPSADARWLGEILGRLSAEQIRDAFRSAGYTTEEVEAFGSAVEQRIAELKKL